MIFRILLIAIPFIWFGAVAAISFMEAPLKFQAPNITLELGLGIGRLVFFALNKIEIVLAFLMVISLFAVKPKAKTAIYVFGAVALILLLQSVWLLPVLDARALQLLAGNPPPPSNLHLIYIFADALKLILLFVLGVNLTRLFFRGVST